MIHKVLEVCRHWTREGIDAGVVTSTREDQRKTKMRFTDVVNDDRKLVGVTDEYEKD